MEASTTANSTPQIHGNTQHQPGAPFPRQIFNRHAAPPSIPQQTPLARPPVNYYLIRADGIGLSHNIPGVGYLDDALVPPSPWKVGDDPISPEKVTALYQEAVRVLQNEYERAQQQSISTQQKNQAYERYVRDYKKLEIVKGHRIDIWIKYHQEKVAFWSYQNSRANITHGPTLPPGLGQPSQPNSGPYQAPRPPSLHSSCEQSRGSYASQPSPAFFQPQPSPGFHHQSQFPSNSYGPSMQSPGFNPPRLYSPDIHPSQHAYQGLPRQSQSFSQQQPNMPSAESSQAPSRVNQNNQLPIPRSQSHFTLSPIRDLFNSSQPQGPYYGYSPDRTTFNGYNALSLPTASNLIANDRGIHRPSVSNAVLTDILPIQAAGDKAPLPSLQEVAGPMITLSEPSTVGGDPIKEPEKITVAKKAPVTRKAARATRAKGKGRAATAEEKDDEESASDHAASKKAPNKKNFIGWVQEALKKAGTPIAKLPTKEMAKMLAETKGNDVPKTKSVSRSRKGRAPQPPIDEAKGLQVNEKLMKDLISGGRVKVNMTKSTTMPSVALGNGAGTTAEPSLIANSSLDAATAAPFTPMNDPSVPVTANNGSGVRNGATFSAIQFEPPCLARGIASIASLTSRRKESHNPGSVAPRSGESPVRLSTVTKGKEDGTSTKASVGAPDSASPRKRKNVNDDAEADKVTKRPRRGSF